MGKAFKKEAGRIYRELLNEQKLEKECDRLEKQTHKSDCQFFQKKRKQKLGKLNADISALEGMAKSHDEKLEINKLREMLEDSFGKLAFEVI